jgi:hypothetical protein
MARAAWGRGRARQPVVSYVSYSLNKPWGEPRVVLGIDADEAEYLADFLGRDECAQRVQIPQQQGRRTEAPPETTGEFSVQATEQLAGGRRARRRPEISRLPAPDLTRPRPAPDLARPRPAPGLARATRAHLRWRLTAGSQLRLRLP